MYAPFDLRFVAISQQDTAFAPLRASGKAHPILP